MLHHLVGPTGKVVGIDHIHELVDWSVENLKKDGLGEALEKKQIEMVVGDGRQGTFAYLFKTTRGNLLIFQAMRVEVCYHLCSFIVITYDNRAV